MTTVVACVPTIIPFPASTSTRGVSEPVQLGFGPEAVFKSLPTRFSRATDLWLSCREVLVVSDRHIRQYLHKDHRNPVKGCVKRKKGMGVVSGDACVESDCSKQCAAEPVKRCYVQWPL